MSNVSNVFIQDYLEEKINNSEYTIEQAFEFIDLMDASYVEEAGDNTSKKSDTKKKNPFTAKLMKLRLVKRMNKENINGPDALKKFVDSYYDKILKICNDLAENTDRKLQMKGNAITGMIVTCITAFLTVVSIALCPLPVGQFAFVAGIVSTIVSLFVTMINMTGSRDSLYTSQVKIQMTRIKNKINNTKSKKDLDPKIREQLDTLSDAIDHSFDKHDIDALGPYSVNK